MLKDRPIALFVLLGNMLLQQSQQVVKHVVQDIRVFLGQRQALPVKNVLLGLILQQQEVRVSLAQQGNIQQLRDQQGV